MHSHWFWLPLCLLLAGCPGKRESPSALPDLQTAPARVTVGATTLQLSTYLWRDFMPGPAASPNGSPLTAVVTVTATGGALPAQLDADRLWVLKDGEVWETAFSSEERPAAPGTLEKLARGGPTWGPGMAVDVVERLIDRRTGTRYLLKAAGQPIERTE